tara:strand:- start:4406 stop:5941 length:1536 start_codon:yes stop_codon:yes gene_type:complete
MTFKRSFLGFALSAFLTFGAGHATAQTAGMQQAKPKIDKKAEVPMDARTPLNFSEMAEALLPTVVNVSTTQAAQEMDMGEMPQFPPGSPFEDFFNEFYERHQQNPNPLPGRPSSLGSGFIIDAENGYVVTNNHVIKDADEIKIILHDDTTLSATVVGTDEKTDLAVLQVKTDRQLMAAKWGDSNDARVGSWVIAIGNPFGLGGTVTAGIVSARQRNINAGPYDDFIQTDASINRGNSGGPMFDMTGSVIGVNTAIFSPSGGSVGIGFAVPSSLAQNVVNQLVKYGKTRRGWLGVRIQNVTDEIAESLDLDTASGALVASVSEDGPAEQADIRPGDIILNFNGQDINAMRGLPRIVADTEVGKQADVTVWRNGKAVELKVTLGELEKAEEEGLLDMPALAQTEEAPARPTGSEIAALELSVSPITPNMRERYSIEDNVNGVVVTSVDENGRSFEKGLVEGDVISEVDQKPVQSVDAVKSAIKGAQDAGKKSVLLLIKNAGDMRFAAIKLDSE